MPQEPAQTEGKGRKDPIKVPSKAQTRNVVGKPNHKSNLGPVFARHPPPHIIGEFAGSEGRGAPNFIANLRTLVVAT